MIAWIKTHRTWTLFLILGIVGVIYLGYINLWQPLEMIADAKVAAGETANIGKEIIKYISSDHILELIKVLTPFLLPIITWKIKSKMDNELRHTTNKIVRQKLGINDRRKTKREGTKNNRKKG